MEEDCGDTCEKTEKEASFDRSSFGAMTNEGGELMYNFTLQ